MRSACKASSRLRIASMDETAAIFCTSAVTKGFCDGAGTTKLSICLMVAWRMNLGGRMFLAASRLELATASSMRVLTWPRAAM